MSSATTILLQDGSGTIWAVGVNTSGLLTTTVSSGLPAILFMNSAAPVGSWQVAVNTSGLLTTAALPLSSYRTSLTLVDSSGQAWAVTLDTLGQLQTTPSIVPPPPGVSAWVPNGFGAGTDNSVVGGGGGFMAYPQPIVIDGPIINFVYNSGTSQGAGNYFVINNPGSN